MDKIKIPEYISIRLLAEKINKPVVSLLAVLMQNGMNVTLNDTIDFATAEIIADEVGVSVEKELADAPNNQDEKNVKNNLELKSRTPVVTIMGHVDHGKTSLLDYIRKTSVASGESGGITQNITAYQVSTKVYNQDRSITFIDTPGHKAFAKMRQHGSILTDIIILVVAADDGVKPQTEEVIEYINANKIPVICAINKIDAPGSDPNAVKTQLANKGINPEEWGGDTVMVEVSAKSGKGINDLLEHIILLADTMDLKADFSVEAKGVVIESHQQKGLGPVALLLITNGILNKNDIIIFGNCWGKIRMMENTSGQQIQSAPPSTPVRIAGIKNLPDFGDYFVVVKDEKEAKELIESQEKHSNRLIKSIEKDDGKKIIKFILKAETQGTLEALSTSIKELENKQIKVSFTKLGIGLVNDSDADLAVSTGSIIVAFRVGMRKEVAKIIQKHNLTLIESSIIYEIVENIKTIIEGMTEKEFEEVVLGRMKILGVFFNKGKKQVIGGEVVSGKITETAKIRLIKNQIISGEGKIDSLEREKVKTDEVTQGHQCGMSVSLDEGAEVGDMIEAYILQEIKG